MQTRHHPSALIHEQAKKYSSRDAPAFRSFGSLKWKTVSWKQFSLHVRQVSNALIDLGSKPQGKTGVFAQNCLQYPYTDFGAYGVRVVSIPLHATSSEQQIQYIINNAQIRFLFVGEQKQCNKAHRVFSLCPTLERIIISDHSIRLSAYDTNAIYFEDSIRLGKNLPHQLEVERRWTDANDEDICNILYTSGTTGVSKGVVLTYGQYGVTMEANGESAPVGEEDRVVSSLPITHIFERGRLYLCLTIGTHVITNTYPREIQQTMREMKPTATSTVPRFWEKVYTAVKERIDSANPVQEKLFNRALAVGKKYNIDYLSKGKRPPFALSTEYQVYNKSVMILVRKQISLQNPYFSPTAGAYVSPEVEGFVHSIGIYMMVGYGLTESLATVSCGRMDRPYTVDSVGRPADGTQIRIGENNEIPLKGPTITRGYYELPNANAAAFDEDGFSHMGDVGYMKDGELYLTERIKGLSKTGNGKYVAPQMVEAMLLVDKYVDQVVVIADQRKFVLALIVPKFRLLEEYASDHGIAYVDREDLCENKRIKDMMVECIKTLRQSLTHYEQIKRFTLLPHHFNMERGGLTDTLKIRRPAVYKIYKDVIDSMYEE